MNLDFFWDKEKLSENKKSIKKVFFYRICGMGMGTSATLLKESGYEVAGCDSAFYPPMGDYLKKMNVMCFQMNEVSLDVLKKYDLVVVGNSVSANTEDSKMIENSGVPFTSFPCMLGELILKDRVVIGIAGTHGKTTSTYYMTQLLTKLGEDVGYLVGGVLTDRPASKLGKSKYFTIESDEYDSSYFQKFSKFRQYNIKKLILTSLEYDHADIFKSVEEIEKQFHHILPGLDQIIFNGDYQGARNVVEKFKALKNNFPVYSFGLKNENGPLEIKEVDGYTHFTLKLNNQIESFKTNIIGRQNILNICGCILFAYFEGFKITDIKNAILDIKNVKRRQELRGKYQQAMVIDDFAHHPTAVDLTLDSIHKAYPKMEINVVFEAITSTARSNAFQKEFSKVFKLAKNVIVVNPKLPTNASQFGNMDYSLLAKDLNAEGVKAVEVENLENLRKVIDELTKTPSVLAIFSNRTVLGLWESDFVQKIIKL